MISNNYPSPQSRMVYPSHPPKLPSKSTNKTKVTTTKSAFDVRVIPPSPAPALSASPATPTLKRKPVPRTELPLPPELVTRILRFAVEPEEHEVVDKKSEEAWDYCARRNFDLATFRLVNKQLAQCAADLLFGDLRVEWRAGTVETLIDLFEVDNQLGKSVRSLRGLFWDGIVWARAEDESASAAEMEGYDEDSDGFPPPINEALDEWMHGPDGAWEPRHQDQTHGAITALFRLLPLIPNLQTLVLDEWSVDFEVENPKIYERARVVLGQIRSFSLNAPSELHCPSKFPALLLGCMTNLQELELDTMLVAEYPEPQFEIPYLPHLRHLRLARCHESRATPNGPLARRLASMKRTLNTLSITGMVDEVLENWTQIFVSLNLSSLEVEWRSEEEDSDLRRNLKRVAAFQSYVAQSRLERLHLGPKVDSGVMSLLQNLPPSMKYLRFIVSDETLSPGMVEYGLKKLIGAAVGAKLTGIELFTYFPHWKEDLRNLVIVAAARRLSFKVGHLEWGPAEVPRNAPFEFQF
ncbi:hypothetical protein T439DRAFT_330418 [Meredithblackwellia eburnea MCA 4105]